MDHTNIQWKIESPFYIRFRKHYCPECNLVLNIVKVTKVVKNGTEEARRMGVDGCIGRTYFPGNTKVIWNEFECPKCTRRISIEQMRAIEEKSL